MAGVPQPLRILSLDGGGVRGIATLCLLRALMDQIALSTSQPRGSLRPCDYFDLIAGTSTGGLIAIMLGRLRYTVEQAIKTYKTLSKDIFSARFSDTDAKFDHRILEDRIKQIIIGAPCPRPGSLEDDEMFEDKTVNLSHNQGVPNEGPVVGCRVFVVSTHSRGNGFRPVILRSYNIPSAYAFSGYIWQAARATSAAPTYFAPITVDDIVYGDGGTGWNNPTRLAIDEVAKIWPDRQIGCLISLGTGEPDLNQLVTPQDLPKNGILRRSLNLFSPRSSFKLAVAAYCAKCLTDCTKTHEEILKDLKRDHLLDKYYRLNTPGVGRFGLEEWKQIRDIMNLTEYYLLEPTIMQAKTTIAAKITSFSTDTDAQPQLERLRDVENPSTRSSSSAGARELRDSHQFQASALEVSNASRDLFSKPVAFLLSLMATCSLIIQRFDRIKHVSSSLRRLNTQFMASMHSTRHACYLVLVQVPSSNTLGDMSQIESLPDPDDQIHLLPFLEIDAQKRVELGEIVFRLQKCLIDIEAALDKLNGLIETKETKRNHQRIEECVSTCGFQEIRGRLSASMRCLTRFSPTIDGHLSARNETPQSAFIQDFGATNRTTNPFNLSLTIARYRLIQKLSGEVYGALAKACKACHQHTCHSAQFKLQPHHDPDSRALAPVNFHIRFQGDTTALYYDGTTVHTAWISFKSSCKNSRRTENHAIHNGPKSIAPGAKQRHAQGFGRNNAATSTQSKETNQDIKRGTKRCLVETKSFVAGQGAIRDNSASSTVAVIDLLAGPSFCSRIEGLNQEQCLDLHRHLGFFGVGENTDHQVYFDNAYLTLGKCQPTSLYDIFTTMVPNVDRKSFQHERVELAKMLASAMLQFRKSPLSLQRWTGDAIVFMRQPGRMNNIRSIFSAPYLDVRTDDDDVFEDDTSGLPVKNEELFQLAKILTEIAYQAEIERILSSDGYYFFRDPEPDRWSAVDRLCGNISGNLGSKYRAVVRLCLDQSLKDDHLVEADSYEDMVYGKVIHELEELQAEMVNGLHDD